MERRKSSPESRDEMRERHKRIRAAMPAEQVQTDSRRICERLLAADWYPQCDTIYGYYPLGNEADCLPFLEQALLDGKTVALPRTGENCAMEFYRIASLEQVAEGSFHVMEPLLECSKLCETDAVVLVPGVVFDRMGGRYGYGKGYYDRYFARFPGLRRMALAYEHQLEERLKVLKTDIPMERIYTEQCVYAGEKTPDSGDAEQRNKA